MPKRKVRTHIDRTSQYLKILTNLQMLHSPCSAEGCPTTYQHCAGCTETYPCKTAQVLAGKTVAQINEKIAALTIRGDQALDEGLFADADTDADGAEDVSEED